MKIANHYYCAFICLSLFVLMTEVTSKKIKETLRTNTKSVIYFTDEDKVVDILVNGKAIDRKSKEKINNKHQHELELNAGEGDIITIKALKSNGSTKKKNVVFKVQYVDNPVREETFAIDNGEWRTNEIQTEKNLLEKGKVERVDIKIPFQDNTKNEGTKGNPPKNGVLDNNKGNTPFIQNNQPFGPNSNSGNNINTHQNIGNQGPQVNQNNQKGQDIQTYQKGQINQGNQGITLNQAGNANPNQQQECSNSRCNHQQVINSNQNPQDNQAQFNNKGISNNNQQGFNRNNNINSQSGIISNPSSNQKNNINNRDLNNNKQIPNSDINDNNSLSPLELEELYKEWNCNFPHQDRVIYRLEPKSSDKYIVQCLTNRGICIPYESVESCKSFVRQFGGNPENRLNCGKNNCKNIQDEVDQRRGIWNQIKNFAKKWYEKGKKETQKFFSSVKRDVVNLINLI